MSQTQSVPSGTSQEQQARKSPWQKRPARIFFVMLVSSAAIGGWVLLNNNVNSTDPTVTGRPLSNPHTHLHTIAAGEQPGKLYLGTHFGMFTSSDGGKTWPQQRGVLNTMMITAIAVSPPLPDEIAVIALPTSGVGVAEGVYVSRDGGNTWNARAPAALPSSAYPYAVKAGYIAGQFYAFYEYAGWYETRDAGNHWHAITSAALSNMQTPTLLPDPADPNHLWLGGDQGLFETKDDGSHWGQVTEVKGSVASIVASTNSPRRIYCLTDQGLFRWLEGGSPVVELAALPMSPLPSRLVTDAKGQVLYALSGQNIWFSHDGGTSWVRRSHLARGDIIAFMVDAANPDHLYAGFFMPAVVLTSSDGGKTWQTLTD